MTEIIHTTTEPTETPAPAATPFDAAEQADLPELIVTYRRGLGRGRRSAAPYLVDVPDPTPGQALLHGVLAWSPELLLAELLGAAGAVSTPWVCLAGLVPLGYAAGTEITHRREAAALRRATARAHDLVDAADLTPPTDPTDPSEEDQS